MGLWPLCNEEISAASFCHQVAALVPAMFCNLPLVKNYKNAHNSATTEAKEKNKHIFDVFDVCLTIFENYQILFHRISHRFLVTTKLFSG